MNLLGNGASFRDKNLSVAKPSLNPNAAEFVPFSLRSPAAVTGTTDASSKFATSAAPTPGKASIDRSESSVSINSDEEAQQYWRHQLPDDITPDFKVTSLEDTQEMNTLSFLNLSLTDFNDDLGYSATTGSGFMLKEHQGLSPHPVNGNGYAENLRYSVSSHGEYPSPTGFQLSGAKPWDKQVLGKDQLIAREGPLYNGNSSNGFLADLSNEQLLMENADINPLEFLASQFPGFATESLAEVYFASGGDLNLTIEMLAQLELQVDGGFNQDLNSKTLSSPNLSASDFPALSVKDGQLSLAKSSGGDLHQTISPYRSSAKENTLLFRSNSSIPSRTATDFASAVRKMASQESSIWNHDRTESLGTNIGSSRSSLVRSSSYNSDRSIYGDRLQNRGSTRASPAWLETGEAVANMYSEMREEARDHARVRNAYFEQALQAFLIGNKALAKELSIKGRLHNMQMKAAHGKAQESICHQRCISVIAQTFEEVSVLGPNFRGVDANGRERMIDLHGLHVSEAIHVLKRELAVMKNAARSAGQRLLTYICVGTGHHTRGSRTPSRLPTAVQRYLLEEGLDYSEPQPGLLRVLIY